MPIFIKQDIKPALNHGVLVVLLRVFLESEVEVLTDQVKEPSETCVEVDVGLRPPVSGDVGNEKLTEINGDTLLFLQLLHQEYQHLS